MDQRIVNEQLIEEFRSYLLQEEKSEATIEKYLRDVRTFCAFAAGQAVAKELVRDWKQELLNREYAARSINSMLASLNSLFKFLGWEDAGAPRQEEDLEVPKTGLQRCSLRLSWNGSGTERGSDRCFAAPSTHW